MSNRVSSIISDDTLNRIIQIESAGNPNAKAATSSALGLGQQLNATWLNLVNAYHPEWWNGRDKQKVLALRKNPSLNIELLARLTEENARAVGSSTGGDLYLAHFLGPQDAKGLFRAPANTPVSKLVSQAVIRANRSIMEGKSAGEVRAWAQRKMNQPPKADWISRFYTGKGPDPKRVVPPSEPSEVDEDTKGTQVEAPEPPDPPRRDPGTKVVTAPKETTSFGGWAKSQWKAITSWGGGGGFLVGIFSYLNDWKVVVALFSCGLVTTAIIFLIWRWSRK